jgi:hypothetical protein
MAGPTSPATVLRGGRFRTCAGAHKLSELGGAGMRQTGFSKLTSARFAPRTSLGLANVSAANFNAALIVGHPSKHRWRARALRTFVHQ